MSDPGPPQAEPQVEPPLLPEGPASAEAAAARPRGVSPLRIALIVIPVVLLAALVGFGWALGWHEPIVALFKPALAPARGKITYNGKPVPTGYVETWPVSKLGETALGQFGPDGSFELRTNGQEGATIGEHRLVVLAMTEGFPPRTITPARYAQPATTPLRIKVTSDPAKNVFEFDLTDEPAEKPAAEK